MRYGQPQKNTHKYDQRIRVDHSRSFQWGHPPAPHPADQLQLLIAEHIALAGVVLDEESGEDKCETVKEDAEEEALDVPGNGRKSERLERLERFHHLRLEA